MPQGIPMPSLLTPCPNPGGTEEILQACLNSALPSIFQTQRLLFTRAAKPRPQ